MIARETSNRFKKIADNG